ncbi:MAG: CPBP family intramembrane glutamic endopeptidase [bacterium]
MTKSTEVGSTQKMLNVWAIVLILWSLYRVTFKASLPIWFDEFIAKPAVFLIPLYWFVTRSEKQSFLSGIGFLKKNMFADIAFGFGIGCLFVGIALLTRITKRLPLPSLHISSESIIWVLSTVMAASMEQVLSTGFVFKRLSQESKSIVKPLIISALLFFFLHIPVLFGADKISGSTLVQMMILNTVLSLTTSVVFLLRKNTIASILVHALYLLSLPILLF